MPHNFHSSIIRAYDIRGIYSKTLHDQDAYYLGRIFAYILKQKGDELKVVVGRDGRLSSPNLHAQLVEGLVAGGAEVLDIGVVPTPCLYYANIALETTGGIMITGSHNPKDHNGFKIIYKGASFYGDDLINLAEMARTVDLPSTQNGKMVEVSLLDLYIQKLLSVVALNSTGKKLRIAWDPGNGATCETIKRLVAYLPGEHFVINADIDGNFPAHHPDPTVEANLLQLKALIKNNKCDLGIAFDGDGDRIGIVDANGYAITGEQLLLIYAMDLVKRYTNPKVIADVKTGNAIFARLKQIGSLPIMWKTGHSHIKAKMKQEGALLAGEMSGHIFFGENYYNFDDAILGGCKVIKILTNSDINLSEIIRNFPKTFSTEEIKIEVPEEDKFAIIEQIKDMLDRQKYGFDGLDGIRVSSNLGWWLIRASNTQNYLILRVESESKENFKLLCGEIAGLMGESRYSALIKQHLHISIRGDNEFI